MIFWKDLWKFHLWKKFPWIHRWKKLSLTIFWLSVRENFNLKISACPEFFEKIISEKLREKNFHRKSWKTSSFLRWSPRFLRVSYTHALGNELIMSAPPAYGRKYTFASAEGVSWENLSVSHGKSWKTPSFLRWSTRFLKVLVACFSRPSSFWAHLSAMHL